MVLRSSNPLAAPYLNLKLAATRNLGGPETAAAIDALVTTSLLFLNSQCGQVELVSHVSGKSYFAYALKSAPRMISRPVNKALFQPDPKIITRQWADPSGLSEKHLARLSYTVGTAYSVASDLFDRNNKKGPATYFEALVGHIFARELGRNPTRQAMLLVPPKTRVRLTMDFLFELPHGKFSVHLPVKMSTRERVVQAWAHQRLLDASYGEGKYKAILVIHSETKLGLVNRDVVEICVPDQWLAYQTFLAKMERIYYFDVPLRYAQLSKEFPVIQLRQFGDFFLEKDRLLGL
ncbi:MAG: hypothetical protein HYY00_02880 [Chloroflexi bacterium]|nr:hypothetical protein [Chloroflexota bacterium]